MEIGEPDNVTVIPSAFVPARDGDALAGLGSPNIAIYISKDGSQQNRDMTYSTTRPGLILGIVMIISGCTEEGDAVVKAKSKKRRKRRPWAWG